MEIPFSCIFVFTRMRYCFFDSNFLHFSEDDKSTRRKSYIQATAGDTMNVDGEYELDCDSEAVVPVGPQRR